MDYLHTVLKFVTGGLSLASLLAHGIDPKYGRILVAAPITTLAFIFTYSDSGRAAWQPEPSDIRCSLLS